MFTCFPDINSPVFPILDDIYCMLHLETRPDPRLLPTRLYTALCLSVGWSLEAPIPASRPLFQHRGLYPCLKAPIPATRPQSQPPCPNPSLLAPISASKPLFHPPSPNPRLQAPIPASMPKSQPTGPNPSLQAKIPAY